MKIRTINPATEEVLQVYPLLEAEQVDQQIEAAHASFLEWRKTSFDVRRNLILKLAKRLREKQDDFAVLMAKEMGKPITQGKAEIEKCAWVCEYYAAQAKTYLEPKIIQTELQKSKVCYQPLGAVFAIMPWNFPFWQVFRFAAPNIMAGNVAILKHAPISTGSGNAIRDLFLEVGFPEYVFQHFIIDNDMAAHVIEHPKVVGVTLTGSERAGKIVASHAARYLKKAVLELGGSDPYLVLADADLDLAAQCIVRSRLNNNGQTCVAAKRVIVANAIAEALTEKIIELIESYTIGDPLDPKTQLGPMARADLREGLHHQVLDSVAEGARLRLGGVMLKKAGYYYPPTILTDVRPGMPAFDDELFGPVFAIINARDEDDAIHLANQSRFGLGSAIFTRDIARGEKIATQDIEAGSCFVNSYVSSDPRLPFGGIKNSGFGRELSQEGMLEFVNIKTVAIA